MTDINWPTSRNLTLDRVIGRLSQQPDVESVLMLGSATRGELGPASDSELVIVLQKPDRSWFVGVTEIDERMADLIFVTDNELQAVEKLQAPVAHNDALVPVIRWLSSDDIRYDRTSRLGSLQEKLKSNSWVAEIGQDLWHGYFAIRGCEWDGDKAAVRYLLAEDPEYLEIYERFLAAKDVEQKLESYREAAALATAPAGGLWTGGATIMNRAGARTLWQELMSD